jgi:TatD DNase family protein
MRSGLVDFHCHLDLYPDHVAAVQRCEAEGVFTLAVTTTPKAWSRNQELATQTRHVRAALGLHPQLIGERAHEITLWEDLLPLTRYVGEVGLDAGPRFYKSFEKQKEIFARILTVCAAAGDKVLSIHSVRATKIVLDMIEQFMPPGHGQKVLHWFTGTPAEAKRAVDLGCYFSINAEMLMGEKRRALVQNLPQERLLTETDGPFTQTGSRPAFPSDVLLVVDELARMKGGSISAMEAMILRNLKSLLAPTT